jgi:putative glycosyltransferase (TIGR04372 family)
LFNLISLKKDYFDLAGFLHSQTGDIRRGGLGVLAWKFFLLLLTTLALLAIPLVRALRPLVLIRFGIIGSERIGRAGNTELYLCERDAGMCPPRTIDIFYHMLPIDNRQLKKMRNRVLNISFAASLLHRANRLLPGYEPHTVSMPSDEDIHGLLERTPAHLSFTPEEERRGFEMLRELGVPDEAPFICFHARDAAYLEEKFPNRKWRYHDFRDSNIENYVPAAEELARRGYYLIRMGAVVKEALKTANPKIIDYAKIGRNDFMDIFLSAKCRFFIGSAAGLTAIPRIFRRPVVYANFAHLGFLLTCTPRSLVIMKKLWLSSERRFLTFREMVDSGVGRFGRKEQYDRLGIAIIENTPGEITDLTLEMDDWLKGEWQTSEEDEELQRRFRSILIPDKRHEKIGVRIGTEFLRQNRELLK